MFLQTVFVSLCLRFVMCFFLIVYHQVQVGRLKDQVQKLNDEKEDIQLRESKLNQENARYTLLIHRPPTYSLSSTPFLKGTVVKVLSFRAPFILLVVANDGFLLHIYRLDRQMRELKEEMASLSRQEEEHKKRKIDAVSILCLAFQFSSGIQI